jgi:multidrug resistance efflux pump
MQLIPSELSIGDVYLLPLLIASLLGFVAAWLTAQLLNRYRLSRFFAYPPLVLLAFAAFSIKYWDYLINPWTRDGQVRAKVIQVASRVSGPIVSNWPSGTIKR